MSIVCGPIRSLFLHRNIPQIPRSFFTGVQYHYKVHALKLQRANPYLRRIGESCWLGDMGPIGCELGRRIRSFPRAY